MLSVIIPVYNEESSIKTVVKSVLSLDFEKEIILVDDGSTDRTIKVIELEFGNSVKILRNEKNQGKGFSIREGLKAAKGDYVAFQDADFEYPPSNLRKLYSSALSENVDGVIGIRTINWEFLKNFSLGSLFANKIIQKLTGLPDVFSGQRIIKKEVLDNLKISSKGFDIETEISLKMLNNNCSMKWIPIKYMPRTKKEGKKIGALDFFVIMYRYYKLRYDIYSESQALKIPVGKN